jgi:hypothetical protein
MVEAQSHITFWLEVLVGRDCIWDLNVIHLDNIKIGLKERGCEDVNWMEPSQCRWALLNPVMDLLTDEVHARVLEKLLVRSDSSKFLAFMDSERFITVFTRAHCHAYPEPHDSVCSLKPCLPPIYADVFWSLGLFLPCFPPKLVFLIYPCMLHALIISSHCTCSSK